MTKFCNALRFSLSGVLRYGSGVQRRRIDIEGAARVYEISHKKSDEQRKTGDHFKI